MRNIADDAIDVVQPEWRAFRAYAEERMLLLMEEMRMLERLNG